jgi:hypothetical protein
MPQTPSSGKKSRAGTALVETALSLLLFTSILFSLFDFGYVMFMHQMLASRVQNAARYGSLIPQILPGCVTMCSQYASPMCRMRFDARSSL